MCAAALTNLAFQCSIPAQRTSPLFHTNVKKFATGYCRDLVDGVPFASLARQGRSYGVRGTSRVPMPQSRRPCAPGRVAW